ncbi:MAG: twin-arginine translocase TatA/TatE family subunit [Caldilineaceae bacterium]|nr:twin-arginine translocase TatA/TatE family subunit [Caldilineaceae bacterium]MDE0633650.1 twin-arginine translocase TatA/TatE family subunit [Caldilineaceae bacterium]
MGPTLGPTELILILVIVIIFFGVGRLPEVFGGLGRGIREFRKAAKDEGEEEDSETTDVAPAVEGAEPAVTSEANPPEKA